MTVIVDLNIGISWARGSSMGKYVLGLCFLSIVGCAALQERSRLSKLETTLDAYERALCWGDYQVVASFMKTQGTDRQNPDLKKLENIKVTSCQLINMQMSEDKLRVHQAVNINYFHTKITNI